ncbi:probable palmitoyltransferase ZDHHC11 [Tupaia chinensis]|uniref:probable palmitoyltransferase ZDHHC11 n=1 Tax=Tupaia chinensis TaxID=246437 RepID=UPI0003C91DD8|nr:probable palmitoyltransferase ZDHHC11 [Tupaia chinensis]
MLSSVPHPSTGQGSLLLPTRQAQEDMQEFSWGGPWVDRAPYHQYGHAPSCIALVARRTASVKQTAPPRFSRVNGWSLPLHSFQAVGWSTFLVMSLAAFGVFIPFLPQTWKCAAYAVIGGLFAFHLVVHLTAVSIDPAEPNVRLKKSYLEPVPTFDRSKHTHVIQNQYCHLCAVPVSEKAKHCSSCNKCVSGFDHHCKWLNNCVGHRNYWYFFLSVASASACLVCLLALLLYVLIQYFVDPRELRTDPQYKNVLDRDTWLLFLPCFPVKAPTPVVLALAAGVPLLGLLLVHLLLFHVYLRLMRMSTFDYMVRGQQERTMRSPAVRMESGLPQEEGDGLSPFAVERANRQKALRTSECPPLFPTAAIHPEGSMSLKEGDDELSPSAVGRMNHKEFLLPSRCSSLSLATTTSPESSPVPEVLAPQSSATSASTTEKSQQDTGQLVRGDSAKSQGLATGAQVPTPATSSTPGHFSVKILPTESYLESGLPHHGPRPCSWSMLPRKTLGSLQRGQKTPSSAPASVSTLVPSVGEPALLEVGRLQPWDKHRAESAEQALCRAALSSLAEPAATHPTLDTACHCPSGEAAQLEAGTLPTALQTTVDDQAEV